MASPLAALFVVSLVAAAAEEARQQVLLAAAVEVVAAAAVIPAVDHRMLRTTWFYPFRFWTPTQISESIKVRTVNMNNQYFRNMSGCVYKLEKG